ALLAESGGAPLRPTTVWLPEPQARDLLPRSEVISRQTPAAAMDAAPGEAAGPAGRRRGGLWAGLAVLLLAGAAVALVLWGGGGDTPASQPTGGLVQPTPALSGAALTDEPGDATSTVGPTLTPLPRPTDTVAPAEEPGETPAAAALAATRVGEDGKLLRLVPAGPFVRGSTAEEVDAAVALCRQNPDRETCAREDFASEMPPRTVTLRAFYMDETEVTNDEYRACVAADACEPPAEGSGDYRRAAYFDEPAFGDYPVVYVSWEDAAAYCEWAGRRLPTEAEWEKGARGENGAIFPWGDAFDSSRANTQDRGVEEITAVGQYPTGASPYGLLDMAGNVWEYVADWFDPAYYAVAVDADPPGPDESPSGEKVLRSGSYANFQHYARAANRGAVTPDSRTAFRGFRCAVDAAP
ncbi:MAG: formylglycine-generating enzyme family protein, partial [Anaerolineales bacterium]|nr:formylglycine-generating enzyme family protein [Anaerolineales bacterium]